MKKMLKNKIIFDLKKNKVLIVAFYIIEIKLSSSKPKSYL